MSIFRILGLIGSASGLAMLAFYLNTKGLPTKPTGWWLCITLVFCGFNLVPVTKSSESLIGLWIEAKRSELKKRINE